MSAGGTWTVQNKVRPGAYINFKGVPTSLFNLGTRGVMTMPLALDYGDTITEVLASELLNGESLKKIGYTAFDEEAQVIREALRGCSKAIIYRLDAGGVKASGVKDSLTVTAKYAGTRGNVISFAVVAKGSGYDVITFFDGVEKDRQYVTTVGDLIDNDFVDFSGTGTPVLTAGVTLTSGANGTVTASTAYPAYLLAIDPYVFNTMAIPANEATIVDDVATWIKARRDNEGIKCQAVLYDYATADHEGIISVDQGYTTETETVSATTFVATVAGLTAGAEVNQSLTNFAIEGAVSIVGELTNQEIIDALQNGQLVLSKRQDGTIKIEQDINTFTSYVPTKGYTFSKNRVIRTLDEINNTTKSVYEGSYMGKVDNNAKGRDVFKGDMISYITTLQTINAVQNFDSKVDIAVTAGTAVDAVVVDLYIQPVDSMEKLYMTVNVK